ncbi:MAG: Asp23/Gls24 family envelope stress response protein [Chlamydiales bacterium]|nr:Asp23/Gls24 family envelope stress response protein [Chlamydiales bacterium]
MHDQFERMDAKELDFPDTVFVHDVESRVFQAITVQALAEIEGIGLIEGNLFDNLLGREGHERIKGIHVEQDQKNHSLSVKLEINVAYGVHLPLKAQEIQAMVTARISELTGLHVATVHVVFKDLIRSMPVEEAAQPSEEPELVTDEL